MSKWPNLEALCRAIAEPGEPGHLCPETLTKVQRISGYLNEETRAEYDDFMTGMRALFGVDENPGHDHGRDAFGQETR